LLDLEYALFDDLDLSGSVMLVQCHECGMAYNRSILTENDYLNYYRQNEHYVQALSPGTGGFSAPERSRYKMILEQIKPYIDNKDPFVVDFGCGKGGMLQWLASQHQWRSCGVEASSACRRFIKKHQGVPVYSSLPEIREKADVIILSHVLEHLFAPKKILDELSKLCNKNAIIYVEVPKAQEYLGIPVQWQQLYFEHINHFGIQSLHRLLESCSFNVLTEIDLHFFPNDPTTPISLVFLARRTLNNNQYDGFENTISVKRTNPFLHLIEKINSNSKQISIWGISQYTQLLLGTYPILKKRIRYLFDSSPAKIGRTIRGIIIDSPDKLSSLSKDDLLLIPKGRFATEMLQELNRVNFEGEITQY
jgi:SAM-dependent methyltransferase